MLSKLSVKENPSADPVPSIKNSLISNSKDIPNAGAIATWITDVLSGTEVSITDNYENVLSAFLSGTRTNRK